MKFALAVCLLTFVLVALAEEVNLVKLHVDSFTVVGIQARTTNAREAAGNGVIAAMWGRFGNENLLSRIPHRVDSHIAAVYSDYESDKDGSYAYTLGAKVDTTRDLPPGMAVVNILPGDYAMFTAQGGSPQQMTVDLWKRIWSLEKPGHELHRAYKTDFEVHYKGLQAHAPEAHVDIYIGVRK